VLYLQTSASIQCNCYGIRILSVHKGLGQICSWPTPFCLLIWCLPSSLYRNQASDCHDLWIPNWNYHLYLTRGTIRIIILANSTCSILIRTVSLLTVFLLNLMILIFINGFIRSEQSQVLLWNCVCVFLFRHLAYLLISHSNISSSAQHFLFSGEISSDVVHAGTLQQVTDHATVPKTLATIVFSPGCTVWNVSLIQCPTHSIDATFLLNDVSPFSSHI
jgi:hypothetical protein